jgi:predicted alpha/beta-fold hydrolase
MPIIYSDFRSPWWLQGGNLQTQLPVWIRWKFPLGELVNINTRDGDQLSASWYKAKDQLAKQLIIITHGLEGSNLQHYVCGAIDYFRSTPVASEKADVLAWNLRGCGARDNKTHKLYFSGCVDDLEDVILWAKARGYKSILLVGYSLGANITLRWLGNQGDNAQSYGIWAACTASATMDLESTVKKLDRPVNIIYRLIFVVSMKWRLKRKARHYPGKVDLSDFGRVKSFATYDQYYSAPQNGFSDVDDMYLASSAIHVLNNIQLPCLIVQAGNDPFLAEESIPLSLLKDHSYITLEVSKTGGHVGFLSDQYEWYLDKRFAEFFQQHLDG